MVCTTRELSRASYKNFNETKWESRLSFKSELAELKANPYKYFFGATKKAGVDVEAEQIAKELSSRIIQNLTDKALLPDDRMKELTQKIELAVEQRVSEELPAKLAALVQQDFLEKHAPHNRTEAFFETIVYRMRWLLVFAYLPLGFLLVLIGWKVWGETMEAAVAIACTSHLSIAKYALEFVGMAECKIGTVSLKEHHAAYSHLVLAVLNALDLVLIGALLVMVAISGYENSVSRLDSKNHHTGPTWLGTIDVSSLKVKVASSIIAISSIHLLGAFMAISPGENRGGLISVAQLAQVKWLVIIHATLIISALILALIDWLSPHGKKKDTSATM